MVFTDGRRNQKLRKQDEVLRNPSTNKDHYISSKIVNIMRHLLNRLPRNLALFLFRLLTYQFREFEFEILNTLWGKYFYLSTTTYET